MSKPEETAVNEVDLIIMPGQGGQEKIYDIPDWLQEHPAQLAIYEATFLEADEILKDDFAQDNLDVRLSYVCFNKTPENIELLRTNHRVIQTSIVTTEIALWRVFKDLDLEFKFIAGHSLAEFAAMVVMGTLTFEDALVAVYERAKTMEESIQNMPEQGGMAAVTGLDIVGIGELLDEIEDFDTEIANQNAFLNPQFVLTGLVRNLKRHVESANNKDKVRATLLNVPSAYHHSKYGHQAAESLNARFQARKLAFRDPKSNIKWLGNREQFIETAQEAREHATEQLRRGVLWAQGMKKLVEEEGVKTVVELGAGKALGNLAEREFKGKVVVISLAKILKEKRRP